MDNSYITDNTIISGNSINVDTCCDVSEIKANIKVSEFKSKRIWGQILNCNSVPVPNVLVKLLKVTLRNCCTPNYQGIAHTISDCSGFYQFEVCDDSSQYKIIVSKAATGVEAVHNGPEGLCNSCNTINYCEMQNTTNSSCGCNPNPGLYPWERARSQQNCSCYQQQLICKKSVYQEEPKLARCNGKNNNSISK